MIQSAPQQQALSNPNATPSTTTSLSTAAFLENANSIFGNGFSTAAAVAQEMQCLEESSLAAKRVFSYNPDNQLILDQFPQFKPVVNAISTLIDKHTPKMANPSQPLATTTSSANSAGSTTNPSNSSSSNLSNSSTAAANSSASKSWESLGHCYLALGDFPNAFAAYAHAHRVSPDNNDPLFGYTMGVMYHHYRYHEHAQNCFERVINYITTNSTATSSALNNFRFLSDLNFRLGILYRTNGKYDLALRFFDKTMKDPPNGLRQEDIQLQIAFTFQKMGNIEQADQLYTQLRRQFPQIIELTQQYAWFLYLTLPNNMLHQVSNLLDQALAQHPGEPTLLLLSARVAMKREDMSTAYQNYRSCISYWSDTPVFWCCLGLLYYKNEQIQDAVVAFQRALYLRSELAEAWLNLGLIFEQQDDMISATRIYTAGSQNCPNSNEIQERLKALKSNRPQSRVGPNYQLIDIEDSKFFIQISEQFANEYVSAVPKLPESCFDGVGKFEYDILSTFPKSLFI